MKNYALILASGSGSRSGLDIPKQFYKIHGKTILEYSISAFQYSNLIDEIIIVSNPDFLDFTLKISKNPEYTKVSKVIKGGITRQESSYNGIMAIDDINSNVLIHDAVRPFVSKEIISDCISALKKYNAVNTAVESADTIIEVDENNIIQNVPPRTRLRRCQTPQCFNTLTIKTAHEMAKKNNFDSATDDCSLILKYNLCDIFVVNGSSDNIKITYPNDFELAEKIALKYINKCK